YTFLETGEDTYGQYALLDFLVPPQAGPPAHIHTREDEVFYIVDGEINFQVGNQLFTGTAGDFIPYTRGELHAFKNLGTETARMLVIAAPAGLENFLREAGQPVPDPSIIPVPGQPVSDPSNIPEDDIQKLIALAPSYGLEFYPEATMIGQSIIEDGGITLYGDERSEMLIGSEGSDLIIGRNGEDQFYGQQGNDTIIGGTGNDILTEGRGDDMLLGRTGDDILTGGKGDDLLQGGAGNDTLTGGRGSDHFVLAASEGTDTISDFTSGQDLIKLSAGLEFAQLNITQGTQEFGSDTLVSLTTSNELLAILTGVEASTITSSDFSIV
ncbi:MAG: cupin domain-containing protein, partial [Okeania sp. SIO3B3]|nr:cupin domain-containing protein [Okeania sp. SIO3B3]